MFAGPILPFIDEEVAASCLNESLLNPWILVRIQCAVSWTVCLFYGNTKRS